MRYLLSKIIPLPFAGTYTHQVLGSAVQAGGHGNHFRGGDHVDLVGIRWWQWRGRCFAQRTTTVCLPR